MSDERLTTARIRSAIGKNGHVHFRVWVVVLAVTVALAIIPRLYFVTAEATGSASTEDLKDLKLELRGEIRGHPPAIYRQEMNRRLDSIDTNLKYIIVQVDKLRDGG